MLDFMESSLAGQVRDLERAEAAPYVQMPPSPWWVPPLFGAWFAGYVGTFAWWRENELGFIVAMLALCGGMGAFVGWLARRFGAFPMPGRGTPPPEIRREYRRYATGAVATAVLVAAVMWWAGVAVAAGVAFVSVTLGLSLYQARYERAAAAVRERLA
jgi:hypothetical protein